MSLALCLELLCAKMLTHSIFLTVILYCSTLFHYNVIRSLRDLTLLYNRKLVDKIGFLMHHFLQVTEPMQVVE